MYLTNLIFGIGVFPAMGTVALVATVAGYLLSMILAFALLLQKQSADKDQRISYTKVDDCLYIRPWLYHLHCECPQFVYGDIRQSVSGGVFRYGDCIFVRILSVQQPIVMTVNWLI